ncbi:hypothetical protein [Xanthomonas sp. NCPPB 2632]|jgi:hypothetical protein|uniref:hypothetical protein n=1 Tax=Xanthomonas sp. NCPPB 2632 TaxID=3240912 RepID=UPI0035129DE5
MRFSGTWINLCLACALGFVALQPAHASTSEETVGASAITQAAAITQCSNQALPAGYVVVASDVNGACPGAGVYRWSLSPASNGIQACFGSGYPAPYFITGINTVSSICAGFQGAMTLRLAANNLAVCSPSVIWSPYVITANALTTGQCGGYGISTIAQASEGLGMCSNSSAPAGWTASAGVQASQCQPYLLQTLHRVAAFAPGLDQAPRYVPQGNTAVMTSTGS